jgi:Na+-transporting NADH:ubiquinone oxidoreductase subunit C
VAKLDKDSLGNTFFIAIFLCLVCSVIVSGMAVALKPIQKLNKELDQKKNILRAAGLLASNATESEDGKTIEQLFAEFRVRAVNLETGEYVDGVDLQAYDPIKAARDAARSISLSSVEDIATLRRRENVSLVYIKANGAGVEKLVIPVRGYGLWGTLYGYLALDGDLSTISGLGFYSHKETPGLGGEVDNPKWKKRWQGVRLYDDLGDPSVRLVKQRSPTNSTAASYEVDALSGATFTTRGVENLVNFWSGELGFGPYIQKLKINGVAQG